MESIVNAVTVLDKSQLEDVSKLVKINNELKKLEIEKKELSDRLKVFMKDNNYSKLSFNDYLFSLTETERKTVTSKTKSEFISKLIALNKQHLIKTTIEPDVEGIFTEVNIGNLDKNFVDQYIKVTPVTTLRCDDKS